MTKREAYKWGRENGRSIAEDVPLSEVYADRKMAQELIRRDAQACHCEGLAVCNVCLEYTCYLAEDNARQFAGHAPEGLTEGQWEAYEAGVTAGIKAGVKARLAQHGGR